MKWEVLESEYLHRRPWLTVRRDKVRLPDGTVHPEYYVLEYPTWVNVIALTPEGKFVMVKQYRHGLGIVATELCAGVAEEGEVPPEAARRELRRRRVSVAVSGSCCRCFVRIRGANNLSYSFVARGVVRVAEQHPDETEDVRVEILDEEQVWDMLVNDDLKQALMAAPLWRFFALKGRG